MHELSVAVSLVETASRHAADHGAARVRSVRVRIGALSGVEPDALAFSFPVAARSTRCEGAALDVTVIPAVGACGSCGGRSEVVDLLAPCPACGAWPLSVEGGRDLHLESLEVD